MDHRCKAAKRSHPRGSVKGRLCLKSLVLAVMQTLCNVLTCTVCVCMSYCRRRFTAGARCVTLRPGGVGGALYIYTLSSKPQARARWASRFAPHTAAATAAASSTSASDSAQPACMPAHTTCVSIRSSMTRHYGSNSLACHTRTRASDNRNRPLQCPCPSSGQRCSGRTLQDSRYW